MIVTTRIVERIRSNTCKALSTVPCIVGGPELWAAQIVLPDSKTFWAFLRTTVLLPHKWKRWEKKKEKEKKENHQVTPYFPQGPKALAFGNLSHPPHFFHLPFIEILVHSCKHTVHKICELFPFPFLLHARVNFNVYFPAIGFCGNQQPWRDQKLLWWLPFGKCGPLRGGKPELMSSFLIPLCFQLFFQSRSHSLAHWCLDLHHGFVVLSLRANPCSSETSSCFTPHGAPTSLRSPMPRLSSHQPLLLLWCLVKLFQEALCHHLVICCPLLSGVTPGLGFSSQTAELHWSMSWSCMNWGHNKWHHISFHGPPSVECYLDCFFKTMGRVLLSAVLNRLHHPRPPTLSQARQR